MTALSNITRLIKPSKGLVKLLIVCNATVLLINLFVGLLVYQNPITPLLDVTNTIYVLSAGSLLAIGLFSLYRFILFLESNTHGRFLSAPSNAVISLLVLLVVLSVLFTACQQTEVSAQNTISKKSVITGSIKDNPTGLSTKYTNLKPSRVLLMMNDEVLNHVDIPVGESFQIINDGIAELVSKDGKISAGCSLQIRDKKGNTLLSAPDLFKDDQTGKDLLFDKEKTNFLRCIVNTGAPMQADEHYDIKVIFWDKYGDGRIENDVTIRAIDMP